MHHGRHHDKTRSISAAMPARTVQGIVRMVLSTAIVAAVPAQAQEPAQQPRLGLSEDGALVIDQRSKVAWARCVEGTQWNGKTCAGLPLLFDRSEAMAAASTRAKAEGVAWRLPRVNELRHLVNKRAVPPGVDSALFPAAPGTWHWSSTSRIRTNSINAYNYGSAMRGSTGGTTSQMSVRQAWAVDMGTGEASDVDKTSRLPVRLIRPWPDAPQRPADASGSD